MRSIVNAGCIWSGFCLTALTGLYLKHFLAVGTDSAANSSSPRCSPPSVDFPSAFIFWNMLVLHIPAAGRCLGRRPDRRPHQLSSSIPTISLGMVCCMFAFLLAGCRASSAPREPIPPRPLAILFIALALASAFGISVYTTFAFFLIMLCWAVWQASIHRFLRSPLLLFAGGAALAILLLPYLYEITHTESKMAVAAGATTTALPLRPQHSRDHPARPPRPHSSSDLTPTAATRALAKLILLPPRTSPSNSASTTSFSSSSSCAWRDATLSPAPPNPSLHRLATLPITSFIRSAVLNVNDFGIHSALFIQYPLLLLASELLYRLQAHSGKPPTQLPASPQPFRTPAHCSEPPAPPSPRDSSAPSSPSPSSSESSAPAGEPPSSASSSPSPNRRRQRLQPPGRPTPPQGLHRLPRLQTTRLPHPQKRGSPVQPRTNWDLLENVDLANVDRQTVTVGMHPGAALNLEATLPAVPHSSPPLIRCFKMPARARSRLARHARLIESTIWLLRFTIHSGKTSKAGCGRCLR